MLNRIPRLSNCKIVKRTFGLLFQTFIQSLSKWSCVIEGYQKKILYDEQWSGIVQPLMLLNSRRWYPWTHILKFECSNPLIPIRSSIEFIETYFHLGHFMLSLSVPNVLLKTFRLSSKYFLDEVMMCWNIDVCYLCEIRQIIPVVCKT